jgi:DNA repair protein RadC
VGYEEGLRPHGEGSVPRNRSAARQLGTSRSILSWPAADRPREKLVCNGPGTLSDAEILAILLRTGHASTNETALDQARMLISRFGSLRGLDHASLQALCACHGIGPAKAVQIKAALELSRRVNVEPLQRGQPLRSSGDVYRHYQGRLSSLHRETVYVVLLDARNRILGEAKVSEGSLSAAVVHPRDVFRPVIEESAAALILVHNHPSGDPTPSAEDVTITQRLRAAGELMGVKVLDHVIIGAGCYTSLVERGHF